MKRIQAKRHRLGTHDARKVALSCFNDKRYVLDNGVESLDIVHDV